MLEQVLILDESGAKGYSNKNENEVGEFGLIAGFLLDKQDLERFRKIFVKELSEVVSDGKLHMASLSKENKELAIKKVQMLLDSLDIKWIYHAEYVNGHNDFVHCISEKKELLHASLFEKTVIKILCNANRLAHSRGEDEVSILFLSDRIETNVKNSLMKRITPTLRFFRGEGVTIKQQNESGEMEKVPTIAKLSVSLESEDTMLTFASDVISYCTYIHLRKKIQNSAIPNISLNYGGNLTEHPFYNSLVLAQKEEDNFFDGVYSWGREYLR